MRKSVKRNKIVTVIMGIMIVVGFTSCKIDNADNRLKEETEFAVKSVKEISPKGNIGLSGGAWSLIGLIKSGVKNAATDRYQKEFYDDVKRKLSNQNGVLDREDYTKCEITAIGVKLIGENPENVDGYDITKYVKDFEKIRKQGSDAVSFALILSQMTGVALPDENEYIKALIRDINEGQRYTDKKRANLAIRAIQGLSYYKNREDISVNANVEKWMDGLSRLQEDDGSMGSCESTAEMIIALTSLGKDPISEKQFIKDGKSLFDGLLSYKTKNGYVNTRGERKRNVVATEKALLALTSMKLQKMGLKLFELEK